MVVRPDCAVNFVHQLTERFEPGRITEINFEFVVEGFLIAVLPRTAGSRARDESADSLERLNENTGIVFTPIVAVKNDWSRI